MRQPHVRTEEGLLYINFKPEGSATDFISNSRGEWRHAEAFGTTIPQLTNRKSCERRDTSGGPRESCTRPVRPAIQKDAA